MVPIVSNPKLEYLKSVDQRDHSPKSGLKSVIRNALGAQISILMTIALFFSACSSSSGILKAGKISSQEEKEVLIQEAHGVLEGETSQTIIDYFKTARGNAAVEVLQGYDLFLLGKVYFNAATEKISSARSDKHIGMGLLPKEFVSDLIRAKEVLVRSADMEPGAEFAAEALHLAAVIMDHGYLQRYASAMELHKWVMITYPDSPFGKKSAERYEFLKEIFKGVEGSSHEVN